MNAPDRAIRWSTAAAVLGVAAVAAVVSYQHAYEVVHAHGETGPAAHLVPLTVDGLIYASSMVLLHSARRAVPVPRLARWLLAIGITATLAANIAHGWTHGPVGAAVAAWPAVALVGSYELLMWLIRTQPTAPNDMKAAKPKQAADPGPVSVAIDQITGDPDQAAVWAYEASLVLGRPLSERKLAAQFSRSRRWARKIIGKAHTDATSKHDRIGDGLISVQLPE